MLVFQKIFRYLALSLLALPIAALAAVPITGTVTNKTTNKASAGDTVTLIRLQQGMQESTQTKTDAHGRFRLEVPDEGLHLVRVTHDKANYFQPVTDGTNSVDITVYNAAAQVAGVTTNVEEFHISATASELQVVEVLDILNQSSPALTQFGPSGFDFYLPANAHLVRTGAVTEGGKLPVPATAVPLADPGHFTFMFPIRPGETQFGIIFTMPYTGKYEWQPKLVNSVNTLAVVLPANMSFAMPANSPFRPQTAETAGTQTFAAQHITPGQPASFTLSGTGDMPEPPASGGSAANGAGKGDGTIAATDNKAPGKGLDNPLDPDGNREPLAKYKWWIIAGLALLLAIGAGLLLRKPTASATPIAPVPGVAVVPISTHELLLQVLKDEMFMLETERLQGHLTEEAYLQQKVALELILRRALQRVAA